MIEIGIVLPLSTYDLTAWDYVDRVLPADLSQTKYTVIRAAGMRTEGEEEEFSRRGISYQCLPEQVSIPALRPSTEFTRGAYSILTHLKTHAYHHVLFDCLGGLGFYAIQAKRTSRLFDDVTFTVNLDSCSQWLVDGMEQWNANPVKDTAIWYAERYCARHADQLVSPTQYMLDWARKNNWKLCEKQRVIAYRVPRLPSTSFSPPNRKKLVFWSYLQVHSGVDLFCEFIRGLEPGQIESVTFVGKDDWMYGYTSSVYIRNTMKAAGISCKVAVIEDATEALRLVKAQNGLVFIPHKYSNRSWQACACAVNGIPFFTSRAGGNIELFREELLFSNRPDSMSVKLQTSPDSLWSTPLCEEDSASPEQIFSYEAPRRNEAVELRMRQERPLVSICIAHYNHPEFFPMTLRSIARTTYDNYEVVVLDDGSPRQEAQLVFDEMAREYDRPGWSFAKKKNEYLGRTRNALVNKARGQYVVFMDSDNAAKPDMVDRLVFGMLKSGCDCLTCHVDEFTGQGEPDEHTPTLEVMVPMGPVLELGFVENVFGDANFIIRRDCYLQVGGFPEERMSMDDWCFLARLSLKGFEQDVIPDLLFHYRVLENSMVRTGNNYSSLKRILHSYGDAQPAFLGFLLEGMAQPAYYRSEILYRPAQEKYQLLEENYHFFQTMLQVRAHLDRFCPKGSRRRRLVWWLGQKLRLV